MILNGSSAARVLSATDVEEMQQQHEEEEQQDD